MAGAIMLFSLVAAVAALAAAGSAAAGDGTLKATLASASRTLQVDAHALRLSAVRRHPRRLGYSARRFRAAALSARRAVRAERPSSANGREALTLALAAFAQYAEAGRQWSLSSRARVKHRNRIARRHARIAAPHARRGNRLLLAAARRLR